MSYTLIYHLSTGTCRQLFATKGQDPRKLFVCQKKFSIARVSVMERPRCHRRHRHHLLAASVSGTCRLSWTSCSPNWTVRRGLAQSKGSERSRPVQGNYRRVSEWARTATTTDRAAYGLSLGQYVFDHHEPNHTADLRRCWPTMG